MRRSPDPCPEVTSSGPPEGIPEGASRSHAIASKKAWRWSTSSVPGDSSSAAHEETVPWPLLYEAGCVPRAASHSQRKLLLQNTPEAPESMDHHQALRNGCTVLFGCSRSYALSRRK